MCHIESPEIISKKNQNLRDCLNFYAPRINKYMPGIPLLILSGIIPAKYATD